MTSLRPHRATAGRRFRAGRAGDPADRRPRRCSASGPRSPASFRETTDGRSAAIGRLHTEVWGEDWTWIADDLGGDRPSARRHRISSRDRACLALIVRSLVRRPGRSTREPSSSRHRRALVRASGIVPSADRYRRSTLAKPTDLGAVIVTTRPLWSPGADGCRLACAASSCIRHLLQVERRNPPSRSTEPSPSGGLGSADLGLDDSPWTCADSGLIVTPSRCSPTDYLHRARACSMPREPTLEEYDNSDSRGFVATSRRGRRGGASRDLSYSPSIAEADFGGSIRLSTVGLRPGDGSSWWATSRAARAPPVAWRRVARSPHRRDRFRQVGGRGSAAGARRGRDRRRRGGPRGRRARDARTGPHRRGVRADVIAADGSLDRAALGAIVFQDPERGEQLNAITHPAVLRAVARAVRGRGGRGSGCGGRLRHAPADRRPQSRIDEFDLVVVVHAEPETRASADGRAARHTPTRPGTASTRRHRCRAARGRRPRDRHRRDARGRRSAAGATLLWKRPARARVSVGAA